MNSVEPIRDIERVNDIAEYLRDRRERDYIMFMIGVYSGLRISDILELRVRNVRYRDKICITEQKTGKQRRFPINKKLRRELDAYIADKKDYEFLIKSQKGHNSPITRQQAWDIMSKAGKAFGLEYIGTHTLRKTFGYHMYRQNGGDIVTVQKILNHSTPEYTLRYIGITQDTMDKAIMDLHY